MSEPWTLRQIDKGNSLILDTDGTWVALCDAQYVDLLMAAPAMDARLDIILACATARLAEISGDCTTYEDAFHKLEIAVGALQFIISQAEMRPAHRVPGVGRQ